MATTAADVMTAEVTTVTPETRLSEFARICADEGISGCPVMTVSGRLVGMISRTDLLERVLDGDLSSAFRGLAAIGEEIMGTYSDMESESEEEVLGSVGDVMASPVVTVDAGAPIADVARLMAEHHIHRVAVLEDDELAGIVSSLDLLGEWPAA